LEFQHSERRQLIAALTLLYLTALYTRVFVPGNTDDYLSVIFYGIFTEFRPLSAFLFGFSFSVPP
jgi:hypothetical protein